MTISTCINHYNFLIKFRQTKIKKEIKLRNYETNQGPTTVKGKEGSNSYEKAKRGVTLINQQEASIFSLLIFKLG